MADTWRYRFYAMQNGQPGFTSESHLFDLPLNKASFATILQQPGRWSGTVKLTDPGVKSALMGQPPLHLLEEKTAMYVELNGDLVFGGILQQVQYDALAQTAQLQGMDFWGYFAKSRIISWNASYTNVEQLLIAADLINIAQGNASSTSASPQIGAGYVVGGNVGVQLGTVAQEALAGTFTSGTAVTVAWAASAFKNIGQAVSDMGISALGFDWSIDVAYSTEVPTKTFNLWYPRAGRTEQAQNASGAAVVFDMGSTSGQGYKWQSGQTPPANVTFGAGSGAGSKAISAEAGDPSLLDEGWPLLEDSASYTDVVSQNLLDELTLAHLYARRLPISQVTVSYNAGSDSSQPVGSFAIGDDCRLIVPPDPYFPSGYDSAGTSLGENWWRIQQVTTTVNDEGKSKMDLILGLPPVLPGT